MLDATAHSLLLQRCRSSMSALAFFLLYQIVPHRHVPWRHALLGGVVAALLFEAAKEVLRASTCHTSPTYSLVYGTFAVVPDLPRSGCTCRGW